MHDVKEPIPDVMELSRLVSHEPQRALVHVARAFDEAQAEWTGAARVLGVSYKRVWAWRQILESSSIIRAREKFDAISRRHERASAERRAEHARAAGRKGGWPKGRPRKLKARRSP